MHIYLLKLLIISLLRRADVQLYCQRSRNAQGWADWLFNLASGTIDFLFLFVIQPWRGICVR